MRVLLVDDHHLFRQGLKYLLADLAPDIRFDEAGSCAEALLIAANHAAEHPPDLILVDLYMPGEDAMEVLASMRQAFGSAMLVVLSSEDSAEVVGRAIQAGASGFVPKASTPPVLIAALRLVMAGGTYIPPLALRALSSPGMPPARAAAPIPAPPAPPPLSKRELDGLSARQMEVLLKAIQGKANKVIAREMHLSEGTVKAHLSAAFRTLGVQNRTEAVFAAARLGLTPAQAAAH